MVHLLRGAQCQLEGAMVMATSNAVVAAQLAGLRYVNDDSPGITRKRVGKHFSYLDPNGARIRDPHELQRIKSLGIPPAWRDVWICPLPNGHIQATGRDTRGRKQYRYHQRWREVRDATKYNRMLEFGRALPQIRARIEEDLALPGLPRSKVLATVVRLLELTLIRVGNEEYAQTNRSFGLTTLRDRHVTISGAKVRFEFRGKAGKQHSVMITDKRLARIVKRCQDIPGYKLFQYLDDDGTRQQIDSADVNEYLYTLTEHDFTAKDFRTWAGTVRALTALREMEPPESSTQARKNIAQAVKLAAEALGNTPTICRKCYIHPTVIEAYEQGQLHNALAADPKEDDLNLPAGLQPAEIAVMQLLARAEPALALAHS